MTAVVLCGPVGPSTLNPTLIRTQTQPLAISAQLLQPQKYQFKITYSEYPSPGQPFPYPDPYLLPQDLQPQILNTSSFLALFSSTAMSTSSYPLSSPMGRVLQTQEVISVVMVMLNQQSVLAILLLLIVRTVVASKLSKGNIKLLTLLLMKKGSVETRFISAYGTLAATAAATRTAGSI
ncbi:hypothetical protein DPMN_003564 [Dreissena polymorpha]|uniref:Uncharacterized protein n=1 Tax=Dreissena polymorpha TaxID=45954 RepID=A0A9D4RUW6_DREPO|nr:hypothetical protein DPMN_003564 [Dreissena polymorpha]